ncbi:ATP-binding protein [Cupriavidus basilensis]|uniref:histidine kinase n=1 Tax=Cupriavidus basilensis TaxID=68895 RepID=A0ABT6ALF7_9BURK|nr:ATP-binding protein [Cupriavidus basilensis]MDF3833438.1 ATP-binding protein [Cupriavidus basilensis]
MRLLAIIGVSLTLLWSAVAMWMFLDVRNELRTALDDRLAASARMVAGLALQFPSSVAPADGRGGSPLDVIARDGLACEVSLLRGEVMTQTMARTAGSPGLAVASPGYGTHLFGGKLWRTYVLEQGGIRIATADRVDVREGLLRDIALSAGVPFVVALAGSLPLLWFGIGRGLAPIERVRVALAQHRPDDAMPLSETDTPPELRPLVSTIHRLLERVQGAIARERRFTDDAAHELRTPLTAIKTHLQVAGLASTKPQAAGILAEALSNADHGVQRLQGTLDQLLLLARLDGRVEPGSVDCVDAGSAARQAVEDATATHSAAGRLVLEEAGRGVPFSVAIPEALLVSALRNLLDNALRYSLPSSIVQLRVELAGDDFVCFCVLDEGPGLTDAECVQAVERFWRRSAGTQGSGLGLSIVRSIGDCYGGELQLRRRAERGLEARLFIPARSTES